MERRRAVGERRLDAGERPQRRPGDRQRPRRRCARPPRACRPAPAPPRRGSALRQAQDRLVLGVGKMPKAFSPGTSAAVTIASSPGCSARQRIEIAERERRARMRRAHDAHPQRIGRRLVGAELVGAGDLRPAVERAEGARRRRLPSPACGERPDAKRAVSGRLERGLWPLVRSAFASRPLPASGERARRHHRLDDLHVAGAAAQHAAERVLDLRRAIGAGSRARRSVAAISMPGVQMPHCAAPCVEERAAQPLGDAVGAGALDGVHIRAIGLRRRRRGRRRPARRRAARCRRRSRRRRSRSWCR